MAIISIPSSIGGVSIPGTPINLLKGPLASLFGLSSGLAKYQYPRDLGSATRGHYILFSINEVSEAQYQAAGKAFEAASEGNLKDAAALAVDFGTKVGEAAVANESSRTSTTKAVIALYMPETMAFTYNSAYDDTSLLAVAKEIGGAAAGLKGGKGVINKLKGMVGAAGGTFNKAVTVAGSQTARLALQTQGLAINPQKQLLFSGIGFRDYQLVFTFTPYSKKESEDIANIIKEFKKAAAPTITESAGGMFFKVPASFNLQFMFNGKENEKVSRVAESVLTTVDVNYSPNTWSAMDDGAPSQIMLTLNFKEIELIDSKKIGKSFADGGGY
jgi:hypothetical protein